MASGSLPLPDPGADRVPLSLALSRMAFAVAAMGVLLAVCVCVCVCVAWISRLCVSKSLPVRSRSRGFLPWEEICKAADFVDQALHGCRCYAHMTYLPFKL